MAEDLVDDRRVFDGSDDLQAAAAVGAALEVKVEHAFEQSSPAHARCFSLPVSVLAGGLGGRLCRSGNDFTAQLRVGRQHAVDTGSTSTTWDRSREILSRLVRSRSQAFIHHQPRNLQPEPFRQFFHADGEPLKLKPGDLHE
jgi:hypothetical protein